MRLLTIASVAALTMFAAPAFAQGTAGSGGGQSAGTSTEPPTKVWVYGQNGWTERNVGEPMKTQMRGQRVARPMIYWQQGGSWYSMPDAAGSNGQMISDQLSQETPSTGGGAATNK